MYVMYLSHLSVHYSVAYCCKTVALRVFALTATPYVANNDNAFIVHGMRNKLTFCIYGLLPSADER